MHHLPTYTVGVGRVVELAVACCRTRATCVADVGSLMVALGTLAENKVSTWTSTEIPEKCLDVLGAAPKGGGPGDSGRKTKHPQRKDDVS